VNVFGFKPARWAEWRDVLRREHRRASWFKLGTDMVRAALSGSFASRIEWRRKMRVCPRCPIYGPELHRCRPSDDSDLGCGCSVWLIALFKRTCWADDNCPDEKIGWTTSL